VCNVPRRSLVHDVMNNGVPICAFFLFVCWECQATPQQAQAVFRILWYIRELTRQL
jgi:hypothetical protein